MKLKALLLVLSLAVAGAAGAQTWPVKPVRVIVPFPPGGATDILARLVGQRLQEMWGQAVVFENRGGAGGNVGAAEAAKAAPDGYTLFFTTGSIVTANQFIYRNMPFDPERDFVPVSVVARGPQILVVPANAPWKTAQELIDAARAQPGKLSFGSAGIGSQVHIAAEVFVDTAGIDAIHVPYKGEGPGLVDLIGGQINFMVANFAAAVGFVNQGKLRALGVTSRERSKALPEVPAISETLKGFDNLGWFGFMARAGTPREIVDKAHRDIVKALDSTEMRARLFVLGVEPVGNTPAEMDKFMRAERARMQKLVPERKISVQ